MNKKTLIYYIIALIVIACGAFYGGMIYSKNKNQSSSYVGNFQGLRGSRGGSAATTVVSGSIVSNDGESIILQLPLPQGGSNIIFYSSATQITKFASDTPDDLATGEQVSVTGTAGSNGSIDAQSIQIRPAVQNKSGS